MKYDFHDTLHMSMKSEKHEHHTLRLHDNTYGRTLQTHIHYYHKPLVYVVRDDGDDYVHNYDTFV